MKHQNSMFYFIFVRITQWAVHNSPRRRHEFIHNNLYPFNELVSKGEEVLEFAPDWFIDMLAFSFIKALQISLHDEVINHLLPFFLYHGLFFFFLGVLINENPSTSVCITLKVVAILLSFLMTIIITISSHIWCISLDVLFGNFATLNLPFSQRSECKLSSIFEIL